MSYVDGVLQELLQREQPQDFSIIESLKSIVVQSIAYTMARF